MHESMHLAKVAIQRLEDMTERAIILKEGDLRPLERNAKLTDMVDAMRAERRVLRGKASGLASLIGTGTYKLTS